MFLLALASGRRRSEIADLSFEDGCTQWGDQVVYLKTRVGFMAKRLIASRDRSIIVIPSLSQLVGTDHHDAREERFLCLLRALNGISRGLYSPDVGIGISLCAIREALNTCQPLQLLFHAGLWTPSVSLFVRL